MSWPLETPPRAALWPWPLAKTRINPAVAPLAEAVK
jgi:hypothetical protein